MKIQDKVLRKVERKFYSEFLTMDNIIWEAEDKKIIKEAISLTLAEVEKIIQETYKEHSNKCSHTFIFILKQKLKEKN